MAHGRRAGRHVCSSIAFLALIAWGGVCFLPSLHQQQFEEIDNEEQEVAFNRTNKPANEENPAQRLKWFLTNPTASCKKLRRLGGRSCLGAYDGAKLVCLDTGVAPTARNCLVYSFGVGNDFTFDEQMQDFGCEVHAFDHDADHDVYDHRIGPSVIFHKARVGFKTGYFKYCEESPSGMECDPFIRYQTFEDIRRSLGHETRNLDYLKMDIEGGEWIVLDNIMRTTNALNATSQISLEIHFDEIMKEKPLEEKRKDIEKYLAVFDNLAKLGFQIMNFEENELNPQYETVDGVTLAVYAEILLSRSNI
ncbi:uncharacterized protein LOC122250296 [Penaeus japonicus]|uniref:uncharacterized protein LOC122250296 n=1 Tax=Penaeus japonicus TaxID=27405 RepID=UPI001C70F2FC|nr:uncharacterized protein LOC122250296 [Penaeus japonicus]